MPPTIQIRRQPHVNFKQLEVHRRRRGCLIRRMPKQGMRYVSVGVGLEPLPPGWWARRAANQHFRRTLFTAHLKQLRRLLIATAARRLPLPLRLTHHLGKGLPMFNLPSMVTYQMA